VNGVLDVVKTEAKMLNGAKIKAGEEASFSIAPVDAFNNVIDVN
jgi:hypothetical protein